MTDARHSAAIRARLGDLFPFESKSLEINGHHLAYVDEGAGPPIVCVHGNPTWSFYYRRVISAFRDRYRVIAPDHIGCGFSDKPDDRDYPYTLDRRVDDLSALLDHLGVRDATFVLHDWGGMIGMAAALRDPRRVARFVILNTAAFTLPGVKPLDWRLKLIRNVPGFGPIAIRGFNAFAGLATRMACKRALSREVRRAFVAPYDSWNNRIATLRFVQDIPLKPTDPAWACASAVDRDMTTFTNRPAMILWGRHDFVFDNDFLAEWRRRWPQAETHVFEDAGHYALEDAHERILPLMGAFLEKTPTALSKAEPSPAPHELSNQSAVSAETRL
ncbi:MAG: alpha/beta fold hydrolase [Phycisphaerales bacterium]|nr:alpha/beta fold hydrolase [Phycisphaerales bacterium]